MLDYYTNEVKEPWAKKMMYERLVAVCDLMYRMYFALKCTRQQKKELIEYDRFLRENYEEFYFSAERKGYSGTAIFAKEKPLSVAYGINDKHTDEGRVITLEYDNFYLVTCYTPNAKQELLRIDYRMEFEDDMRQYLCELDKVKPVIYCGDLNVAHNEIDLKNPKNNVGNAGFSDEERGKMTELLNSGFTDSFRYLYPDATGMYSWWSYRFNARKNNAGWRIDYFIVSDRIKDNINALSLSRFKSLRIFLTVSFCV